MGLLSRILASREPQHLASGRWGEERAERFLRDKGWKILGRRVRVGRKDELDLIARADRVLVFVEVKTRQSESFGRPFAAVDQAKRRHLTRAAYRYLQRLRAARGLHSRGCIAELWDHLSLVQGDALEGHRAWG